MGGINARSAILRPGEKNGRPSRLDFREISMTLKSVVRTRATNQQMTHEPSEIPFSPTVPSRMAACSLRKRRAAKRTASEPPNKAVGHEIVR